MKSSKKCYQVLLVEDEPLIQMINTNLLQSLGCEVVIASNGNDALTKMVNPYDLIFLDIGLPDFDGFEVCRCIRKQEKQAGSKRTPIVFLTAYGQAMQEKAFGSGGDDFLLKPLSQKQILEMLNTWCEPK